MPRCVAFLRAVNVGGRTVRMDALRAVLDMRSTFRGVSTLRQLVARHADA